MQYSLLCQQRGNSTEGKWTVQSVQMDDEQRPYYLQLDDEQPSYVGVPPEKQWDFELRLFMPSDGDVRIDNKIIAEFEQYLVTNWGFTVLGIRRSTPTCGLDAVQLLKFYVKDPQRAYVPDGETRPSDAQMSTLRQIANVRHRAAGTVKLEAFSLDSEVVAHKATYTVTEGNLKIGKLDHNDGARDFHIKHPATNQYTCFVQGIGDDNDNPRYTADWLADELGLFLLEAMDEPELVELHRGAQSCRAGS